MYLWDVVTAAYFIDPSVATRIETVYVDVDVNFGPHFGAMIASKRQWEETHPVRAVLDIDKKKFFRLFDQIFTESGG